MSNDLVRYTCHVFMFLGGGGDPAFEKVDWLTCSILGDTSSYEHFDVRISGRVVLMLICSHLLARHLVLFYVIAMLVLVLSSASLMKHKNPSPFC